MPTRAQVKREIDRQYAILERSCMRDSRADRLLYDAKRYAVETEKQHRRGSFNRFAKAKQSVETAAKYYVLQAFRDPASCDSVLSASSLRLDVLYGSALRAWLDRQHSMAGSSLHMSGDILHLATPAFEVEYTRDIA